MPVIFKLWNADIPLEKKIKKVVAGYFSYLRQNPQIPQFVMAEMNQNPARFCQFTQKMNIKRPKKFEEQIKQEIANGTISPVDAPQLIIRVSSESQNCKQI